jgi:hypothetical protein
MHPEQNTCQEQGWTSGCRTTCNVLSLCLHLHKREKIPNLACVCGGVCLLQDKMARVEAVEEQRSVLMHEMQRIKKAMLEQESRMKEVRHEGGGAWLGARLQGRRVLA